MAIDVFVFDFLLDYKGRDLGDVLCIGRQAIHFRRNSQEWQRTKEIMRQRFPAYDPDELLQADGYCESFLSFLGARSVTSMDLLPHEGATLIHDLNIPVDSTLHNRFDFILDGGTLEHIYNIPIAIESIKHMLRIDGSFVSINGANNWLGHGLYQFSPDLFWQIFNTESGFAIDTMVLVPQTAEPPIPPRIAQLHLPGERQEIGATADRVYLMVSARRRRADILSGSVYQSDYGAALEKVRISAEQAPRRNAGTRGLLFDNRSEEAMPIVQANVMWRKPLVVYTTQIESKTSFVNTVAESLRDERTIILALTAWSTESPTSAAHVAESVRQYQIRFPRHSLWIMANTEAEVICLSGLGVNAFLMNHNTFVDPRVYHPIDGVEKLYAAVYNAQLAKFKRHDLCAELRNVAFIYYRPDSGLDEKELAELRTCVPRAHFINEMQAATDLYKRLTPEQVNLVLNQSQCGLCLSAIEGAMHASIEYLLAGIPVVSTVNKGGRDFYFDPEFTLTVDPDPKLIAAAVNKIAAAGPSAERIRASTVRKQHAELRRFWDFVSNLLAKEGVDVDISHIWREIYVDKMLGWETKEAFLRRLGLSSAGTRDLVTDVGGAGSGTTHRAEIESEPGRAAVRQHPLFKEWIWTNCARDSRLYRKLADFAQQAFLKLEPTELCKIMTEEGSDKGGHHNYTIFYSFLFGDIRKKISRVFELGIGTNFTDVPSSMGPAGIPGASLRGWRRYFPNANIVGADIDRRILFQEDRIRTFEVDQRNEDSIRALWQSLGDATEKFQFMVDDGLHDQEANSLFFLNSIAKLDYGGYYIIEDVFGGIGPGGPWREFLSSIDFDSAILKMPVDSQTPDNVLIIITHRGGDASAFSGEERQPSRLPVSRPAQSVNSAPRSSWTEPLSLYEAVRQEQWPVVREIIREAPAQWICDEFAAMKQKVPPQEYLDLMVRKADILLGTYASMGKDRYDLWLIELWRIWEQHGRQAAADWIMSSHQFCNKTPKFFWRAIHLLIFTGRIDEALRFVNEACETYPDQDFCDFAPILHIAEAEFELAERIISVRLDRFSPRLLRSFAIFGLASGNWKLAEECVAKIPSWAVQERDRWILRRIESYVKITGKPCAAASPRVFTIAAPQDNYRTKRLKKNIDRIGIAYTHIQPVDGQELPLIGLHLLSNNLLRDRVDIRPLVGCSLSHAKAWEQFLQSDAENCIILEDDAMLLIHPSHLVGLPELRDYDVVFTNERMEDHDKLPSDRIIITPLAEASQKYRGVVGTDGYYLSRRGAKLLLEKVGEAAFSDYPDEFILNVGLGRYGSVRETFGVATPCLVLEYAEILYD